MIRMSSPPSFRGKPCSRNRLAASWDVPPMLAMDFLSRRFEEGREFVIGDAAGRDLAAEGSKDLVERIRGRHSLLDKFLRKRFDILAAFCRACPEFALGLGWE